MGAGLLSDPILQKQQVPTDFFFVDFKDFPKFDLIKLCLLIKKREKNVIMHLF